MNQETPHLPPEHDPMSSLPAPDAADGETALFQDLRVKAVQAKPCSLDLAGMRVRGPTHEGLGIQAMGLGLGLGTPPYPTHQLMGHGTCTWALAIAIALIGACAWASSVESILWPASYSPCGRVQGNYP